MDVRYRKLKEGSFEKAKKADADEARKAEASGVPSSLSREIIIKGKKDRITSMISKDKGVLVTTEIDAKVDQLLRAPTNDERERHSKELAKLVERQAVFQSQINEELKKDPEVVRLIQKLNEREGGVDSNMITKLISLAKQRAEARKKQQ
ncbi:hypothetical protein H0N95_02580 [Candidatus Micrarchaeota archaeon]|nr:hypothetical protein [Candidatus Micrarchaeota archaeon]